MKPKILLTVLLGLALLESCTPQPATKTEAKRALKDHLDLIINGDFRMPNANPISERSGSIEIQLTDKRQFMEVYDQVSSRKSFVRTSEFDEGRLSFFKEYTSENLKKSKSGLHYKKIEALDDCDREEIYLNDGLKGNWVLLNDRCLIGRGTTLRYVDHGDRRITFLLNSDQKTIFFNYEIKQ